MREIEVNTEALQQQLVSFQEEITNIRQTINRLSQTVDELKTMWDGPAHETFYAQYMIDHLEFEEYLTILDKIAEKYQDACKEYNRCESEVGSIISSINS